MRVRLREKLVQRFDEELRFIQGWHRNKKAVGALVPTSAATARRMASIITPGSGSAVLELGAGTGVITRAILDRGIDPGKVVSVEFSNHFYNDLVSRIPGVDFRNGDAFDLESTLGERRAELFDCVISAVPLLSFPMEKRVALIEDLLDRLPIGRPVVQITYGPFSPVRSMPQRYTISHFDFVLRNVPPAQLWLYKRVA